MPLFPSGLRAPNLDMDIGQASIPSHFLQVMQQSPKANELLSEAKDLAVQLEQQKEKLDAAAKKRLEALHAFLAR